MIISGISWLWALAWAIFATVFYAIRYRKVKLGGKKIFANPWTYLLIGALNFFFFAWAAVFFLLIEWARWYNRKS